MIKIWFVEFNKLGLSFVHIFFFSVIQKRKLNVNPTKSETKTFILKRYKDPRNIYIDNQIIQWSKKELDIILDKKLIWNIHTNKNHTQVYARMIILYLLVNFESTHQIKSSLFLYKPIIKPLITYNWPIWVLASSTKIKFKLCKINS